MTQVEPAGQTDPAPRNSLLEAVEALISAGRPLHVGAFEVTQDGRLRRRESGKPFTFAFDFRGIFVNVEVATSSAPTVTIRAMLGALPYSVESQQARRAIRRVVTVAGQQERGRIYFGEDQSLHLEGSAAPPEPCTPAAVVSTVTVLLLDFLPFLDILASQMSFVRPRPQEAGGASPENDAA